MFNPKECDINKGTLENLKTEFQNLHDRICGRAEGYGDVATTTGDTFSDLIASPLKSTARENTESWSSSMMACTVAIGSLSETIEAVDWYEKKIENIRTRFHSAVSGAPNAEDARAIAALASPFNTEANTAWNTLEQKCQDAGETLANGADPDNIRKLIEAGHISADIAFATTGDWDHFYFDPDDAELLVEELQEVLESGDAGAWSSLIGIGGNLSVLSELVRRSIEAQKNGRTLNSNEIEFLENLFGEFTDDQGDGNFIEYIIDLENSEHLNDDMKEQISEALAGAMLAVSDESIGGGYEKVPEDVILTIEGPDQGAIDWEGEYNNWSGSFGPLSEFFSHADNEVQGGVDFSSELTATVSRTVQYADHDGLGATYLSEENFTTMLDLSTRNEDANYVLITGEHPDPADGGYTFRENNNDVDLESILDAFYRREWEDGGEAVSGITDWIADSASDDDISQQKKAGDAFAVFMDVVEKSKDNLIGTGENSTRTYGEGEDQFEYEWKNVSFTELNPKIADGFVDIFEAYIDAFSDADPVDGNGRADRDIPSEFLDDSGMFISLDDRALFTQLIVGDGDAGLRMTDIAEEHTLEKMEEYGSSALDGQSPDMDIPAGLRNLWREINTGIASEFEYRAVNHQGELDAEKAKRDLVADLTATFSPNNQLAEIYKYAAKNHLWVENGPLPPELLPDAGADAHGVTQSEVINIILGELGDLEGDEYPDLPGEMYDDNGNFIRDPNKWMSVPGPNDGRDFVREELSPGEQRELSTGTFEDFASRKWPGTDNNVDFYVEYFMNIFSGQVNPN